MEPPLPRLPPALAAHQESLPLPPFRKCPPPQVLNSVIPLKAMISKWLLVKMQTILKRDLPKPKIFAVHRFLADLPRELRARIIHSGLKAGGLHLSQGSREIPAVNKVLVLLTPDIVIHDTVYLTIPKPSPEGVDWPPDLELLVRNGDGLRKLVINLPVVFNNIVRRVLVDLYRTCRNLTHLTIHQAADEVLVLATRHCQQLQYIDVSGSPGITDEGLSRAVVNLRWGENEGSVIKYFDVGNTSITEEGFVQILTRLPSLTSLGSTDIIEALEAVSVILDNDSLVTLIEEVTVRCITTSRLKTLRKHCPCLNSIKATFQENPGASVNELRLLPGLVHLDLSVREPFLLAPVHLYDLVWAVGSALQTLKVRGDVYWEVDLSVICAHCPFLRRLSLPAITFPHTESLKVFQNSGSPILSQLQELEIDCLTGVGQKAWAKDFTLARRGLVLALSRCWKLQRLVLRPTCLVDSDFLEILSVNRLTALEVLELFNSSLGVSTAKILVDSCINLHIMKGVKTWRGMTLHDLIHLRQYSRGHRRAADLKVIP